MTTRKIVPRADNEGGIGTTIKKWASGFIKLLTVDNLIFPATQVPSSDPNTLDDYEEGIWTATLTPLTSGSITLYDNYKTGWYIKIGKKVTIGLNSIISSVSSPTGQLSISGLPFTAITGVTYRPAVALNVLLVTATLGFLGDRLIQTPRQ